MIGDVEALMASLLSLIAVLVFIGVMNNRGQQPAAGEPR